MPRKSDVHGELEDIRKTIIVAIASDDILMERLVLKGGNALDLVYQWGERSSLDIDFSMEADFSDQIELDAMKLRLFRALRDRFDSANLIVFDERLEDRPRTGGGPGQNTWGGYNATFKLISKDQFFRLGGTLGVPPSEEVLNGIRRQAQISSPSFQRSFLIEISKFEFTKNKVLRDVGSYNCYVYSPAMIAIEKFRAICQQLPGYTLRSHPTPRPRDFYDIHTISTHAQIDLTGLENLVLVEGIFAAKEVPLSLLQEIDNSENRDFHEQQWLSVVNSVRGRIPHEFNYYFDFVINEGLKILTALEPGNHRPRG